MPARIGAWFAVLLACQACHREEPDGARAVAKTQASRSLLRHAGAFDLASSETGAVLIVAENSELRMTTLDRAGKAQKTETLYGADVSAKGQGSPLSPSFEIAEVVAATQGTRLAVGWVEQDRSSNHARGLSASLSNASNGLRVSLGEVQSPIATPRGNLSLASADGQFVAFTRATQAPCADQTQRDCVGYSFYRFDSGEHRAGLPLAVPAPCAQGALVFALSGARWYYGACSGSSGSPLTTLFTIQNDPFYYARADRVLPGCLPMGAVTVADELIVAGDCAGTRRAVRLRGGDRAPEEVRMERLEGVCQAGKPLLVQNGLAGLKLALNDRQDRLEAFLPAAFSLPLARAVWTGQTLLVAGLVDSRITLKGYRCDSTLLREVALE